MGDRIGIGYDIHRLVQGRKLVLGGVEIDYIKGLLGHSDADVLLHAIADALLGAMGEKDIGELFADTDSKYLNISSLELLRIIMKMLKEKRYSIVNIDAVVIAQEPALSPFKQKMRQEIAKALGIEKDSVNLKAKTNEDLSEIGRKEAIASYAVALLSKEE